MEKLTVCVVFGGRSGEYGVSLKSAYTVLEAIDYEKYNVIRLGITKCGKWYLFNGSNGEILSDQWEKGNICPVTVDINSGCLLCENGEKTEIDLVFPVLHGMDGEDGRLQGLLDLAGIKYIGCGAYSSHTGMDKHLSKLIATECGADVSPYTVINKKDEISFEKINTWAENIGYPVFIKDAYGGSSVGVYRAENEGELNDSLNALFGKCEKILIENGISGQEIEIAIMETDGEIKASSVGEIKHKSRFYDYDAKYNSDSVEYIIPALIDEKTEKWEHTVLTEEQLEEYFGLKIIRFEFSEPIQNEFKHD